MFFLKKNCRDKTFNMSTNPLECFFFFKMQAFGLLVSFLKKDEGRMTASKFISSAMLDCRQKYVRSQHQTIEYHSFKYYNPVDTRRKLKVHKTFRRRPGRLLNILSTLDLRPVSAGNYIKTIQLIWSANQAPNFCLFNMSVKLILNDLNKYGERVKFA